MSRPIVLEQRGLGIFESIGRLMRYIFDVSLWQSYNLECVKLYTAKYNVEKIGEPHGFN